MDLGTKTRTSLYWNSSLFAATQGLQFVVAIAVARILNPVDFGVVAIGWVMINYANMLTDFGFSTVMVQRRELTSSHVRTIFTINLCISITLLFGAIGLAPWVARFFDAPESRAVIVALSLIFVITTFYDIPHALMRRDIRYKELSITATTEAVATSLLTLTLALAGYRYWALVWGQMVPKTCSAFALAILASWRPRLGFSTRAVREIVDFGMWNFIRAQLVFAKDNVDLLIVGKFLGPVALGVYDKAAQLARRPLVSFGMSFNAVMFSSFSRTQDDVEARRQSFRKGLLVTSIVQTPLILGLFAVAPVFVEVLLGEKWMPMVRPLEILLIASLLISAGGLMASFNVAAGEYRSHTLRVAMAISVLVVGCAVGWRWGLVGVATAVVVYSLAYLLLTASLVRRGMGASWAELVGIVLPATIAGASMVLVVRWVGAAFEPGVVGLAVRSLTGAAWYLAFVLLYPSALLADVKKSLLSDLGKFRDGQRNKVEEG